MGKVKARQEFRLCLSGRQLYLDRGDSPKVSFLPPPVTVLAFLSDRLLLPQSDPVFFFRIFYFICLFIPPEKISWLFLALPRKLFTCFTSPAKWESLKLKTCRVVVGFRKVLLKIWEIVTFQGFGICHKTFKFLSEECSYLVFF